MISRKWLIIFGLVAAAVFSLKVILAYSTDGAPDMSLWEDFGLRTRIVYTCRPTVPPSILEVSKMV
jgi:hypothetical protein